MTVNASDPSLIRTKLHRPRIPIDFVVRPRLVEILEQGRTIPMTLISAPAGYGKSMLISNWLEQCDLPSVWLSLDEDDSNFAVFLNYFMAAVRQLFPQACQRTDLVLRSTELPPVATIAGELVNEITAIGKPFILVLDDYGRVHNKDVHDLLSFLLEQKLRNLHLVLITRRDPPLPLSKLRAGGDMTEIRQVDLLLTIEETAAFFENAIQVSVEEDALEKLHERTEGWAVGLRMVALALGNRNDVKDFLREMKADTRHIQNYLMSEVLSRQVPFVREGLLKTSILRRFCAPLYRALCHPDCEDLCGPECDGHLFMMKLEESNLFCIALDERREWFRYHHLFQDLLLQTLHHRYEPEEIELLHKQASAWFEKQGLLDESLFHALKCSDTGIAEQLIVRHRHDLMNQEQWDRLRHWIHKLPREVVDRNPELLMMEAWLYIGWPEMADIMIKIESLLPSMTLDSKEGRNLRAEWNTLRALVHYHMTDAKQALDCARLATKDLPLHYASERGMAIMLLSMAYQMIGDLKKARSVLFEALKEKDDHSSTYRGRVLLTFCFIDYMEADMNGVMQSARECLKMGQEKGLSEIMAHGYYFLGISSYERNDLSAAESFLKPVAEGPFIVNSHNFAFSAFALALTLLAGDRPARAREVVDSVVNHALQINNISLLQIAQAFQAELDIRQGKIAEAGIWARSFDPDPFTVAYRFYVPQMTLAKWYLFQDTSDGYQQATDLLHRLHDFFSSTHNTRLLIEVLALQALLNNALGNEAVALSILEQAIIMAEPGGLIRVFLDLGPAMGDLLQLLAERDIASKYVGSILAAFQVSEPELRLYSSARQTEETSVSNNSILPVSLSSRELEILSLLAQRLSNKEVSDKLFISPETVKRHTINLYRKLDVHGRHEAVDRAISLGILS